MVAYGRVAAEPTASTSPANSMPIVPLLGRKKPLKKRPMKYSELRRPESLLHAVVAIEIEIRERMAVTMQKFSDA